MKETKVVEYLKHTFSDEETLALSKTLAKHNQDLSELENEKSRITSDFSARIKAKQADIETISRKVYSGYEFRNIDCEVLFNEPAIGKKTIVRKDTGEEVRVVFMSDAEKQEELPLPEEEGDKQFIEEIKNA